MTAALGVAVVVLLLLLVAQALRRRRAQQERQEAVEDFHVLLVRLHLAHGGFESRDAGCPLCQAQVRYEPQVHALVRRHSL